MDIINRIDNESYKNASPASSRIFSFKKAASNIPPIIFLAVIILTVITTYHTSEYLLDGDTSSEMVLAHHLAETGQLLSRDFIYPTELRVINKQLILSPLFKLFSDWRIVRFIGAMIIQGILVLSFGFLILQAGFRKSSFFLGASLLLLPTSIAYGRIVLYHSQYAPYISISFFLVGLFIALTKKTDKEDAHNEKESFSRKRRTVIYAALLFLVSFLSGLGGIRQITVTHAPLLMSVLFIAYKQSLRHNDTALLSLQKNKTAIIYAVAAFIFCAAGYLVNTGVFQKLYEYQSFANAKFDLSRISDFTNILYGFVHQFGYNAGLDVFTPSGIMAFLGLMTACYCLIKGIKYIFRNDDELLDGLRIVRAFFPIALLTSVFIFLFIDYPGYYLHHFIPATVWAIPFLISFYEKLPAGFKLLNVKGALLVVAICAFFANGLYHLAFFNGIAVQFLKYEGITYNDSMLVYKLRAPVAFLSESDYKIGYTVSTWNANVVTEMTDGKIKAIPLRPIPEHRRLYYNNWLTLKSYRSMHPDSETFILVSTGEDPLFPYGNYGSKVYSDEFFIIYEIQNNAEFAANLQ